MCAAFTGVTMYRGNHLSFGDRCGIATLQGPVPGAAPQQRTQEGPRRLNSVAGGPETRCHAKPQDLVDDNCHGNVSCAKPLVH